MSFYDTTESLSCFKVKAIGGYPIMALKAPMGTFDPLKGIRRSYERNCTSNTSEGSSRAMLEGKELMCISL